MKMSSREARSGVTEIISLSAVGSLREDLPPGRFVIADQFIDRDVAMVSKVNVQGRQRADRGTASTAA